MKSCAFILSKVNWRVDHLLQPPLFWWLDFQFATFLFPLQSRLRAQQQALKHTTMKHTDLTANFLALVWTFFALSMIMVALRAFARSRYTRKFGWDDFFIVITLVSDTSQQRTLKLTKDIFRLPRLHSRSSPLCMQRMEERIWPLACRRQRHLMHSNWIISPSHSLLLQFWPGKFLLRWWSCVWLREATFGRVVCSGRSLWLVLPSSSSVTRCSLRSAILWRPGGRRLWWSRQIAGIWVWVRFLAYSQEVSDSFTVCEVSLSASLFGIHRYPIGSATGKYRSTVEDHSKAESDADDGAEHGCYVLMTSDH